MGSGQIVRIMALTTLLCAPSVTHAASLVPSGTEAGVMQPDFGLFPFWQKLLTDMGPQPVTPAQFEPEARLVPTSTDIGAPSSESLHVTPSDMPCKDMRLCTPGEWTRFLETLKDKSARDQIEAVNRWANSKPYIEDIRNWFIPDYWATPGEFLARGGDCEDFAAIKYFSLIRLGHSAGAMRIMIVRNTRENSFHAILAVQVEDQTLVLDNFLADVTAMESLPYYQPIYSLNEEGSTIHTTPTLQVAGATIVASAAHAN